MREWLLIGCFLCFFCEKIGLLAERRDASVCANVVLPRRRFLHFRRDTGERHVAERRFLQFPRKFAWERVLLSNFLMLAAALSIFLRRIFPEEVVFLSIRFFDVFLLRCSSEKESTNRDVSKSLKLFVYSRSCVLLVEFTLHRLASKR